MKYLIGITVLCCIWATSCKKEQSIVDPPKGIDTPKIDSPKVVDTPKIDTPVYKLVWADEFDYTGLPKASLWDYEVGYVRNQEAQYYESGKTENSVVKNGLLFITATFDATRTNPITSASIMTKGNADFLYGKLEARIKMPAGKGTWPAFWTLGTNREQIGWPACGEIDIMEMLGTAPRYIFGSLHKGNASNKDNPLITPLLAAETDSELSDNFHVYGIEWDSTQISFYFDTTYYATYKADQMPEAEWAQFTKPHYLLLNLAMGGKSGGLIDSTMFPFTYTVDYVRYYRKEK